MRLAGTILFLLLHLITLSQQIPVGFPAVEEIERRTQISDTTKRKPSFTIRPVTQHQIGINYKTRTILDDHLTIKILPSSMDIGLESHHPYSKMNGNWLPAKGLQTRIAAGALINWQFFEIQFRPAFIYSQNPNYEGFPTSHHDRRWLNRYNWWNYADAPEQFGPANQHGLKMGQSYAKVKFWKLKFGISSENLWWGPGKYNSLLMTNNAEGFYHLSLQTDQPLETKIGYIEGQAIAGLLFPSGYAPPETDRTYRKSLLFAPKREKNRYLSGIVLSYNPKWIDNFYIGGAYTNQQYGWDAWDNYDYVPFITDAFKKKDRGLDNRIRPDRYASLFMRWVWPEGLGEMYVEYGRNNFSGTFKDLLLVPEANRAFVFGLSKIFLLNQTNQSLEFNLEITNLAQQVDYVVKNVDSWYIDRNIRHGYTYKGQWMGAGIGPGSSQQTFELNWLKNANKLGWLFERRLNNSDFYYLAFDDIDDFRRYWVDYSSGIQGYKNLGKVMLNGKIIYTRSLNYQWELDQKPGDPYFINGRDVNNIGVFLNLIYLWADDEG